jgi:hypothetical protein
MCLSFTALDSSTILKVKLWTLALRAKCPWYSGLPPLQLSSDILIAVDVGSPDVSHITDTIIETFLDTIFSVRPLSYQSKLGDLLYPEGPSETNMVNYEFVLIYYYFLWLLSSLLFLDRIFSLSILCTVSRAPWIGDEPFERHFIHKHVPEPFWYVDGCVSLWDSYVDIRNLLHSLFNIFFVFISKEILMCLHRMFALRFAYATCDAPSS